MKYITLTMALLLGITACSSEPTEEEIKKRVEKVSTEECKNIEKINEHESIMLEIKKKCASLKIREFKAVKSSEKTW